MDEDSLLNILSRQLDVPFVQLRHYQFNNELVKKLPEAMARRFRSIVLAEHGGELLVGMADPLDIFAYDELVRILKQPIKQAVVRESELLSTLDLVYRRTDEIASLAEELEDELGDDAFDLADLPPNPKALKRRWSNCCKRCSRAFRPAVRHSHRAGRDRSASGSGWMVCCRNR